MKLKQRLQPYYQAIPKLFLFQFVSAMLLSLITRGVSALSDLLIGLSGKATISSGDFGFMFNHWQGYTIIILTLIMVICYVAVELNALILYCGALISGEKPSLWSCIKGGFAALKRFLNPRGVIIILYAVVISPVIGLGFSVSLTKSFYIPHFIMSVVNAKPLYLIGHIVLHIVLVVIAVIYCFILHGVMLDGMKMKDASAQSRKLIAKHWKNFIFEFLRFSVCFLIAALLIMAVFSALPLLIVNLIPMAQNVTLFFTVFFCVIGTFLIEVFASFYVGFLIIKLTILYKTYRSEGEWQYQKREKKKHPVMIGVVVLIVLILAGISWVGAANFDEFFPTKVEADIVAHRAGGSEAPENTVKGIETACELHADGCEIDIQRTSDGYYIVNHDNDFKRVAGVDKKPSEMTLEEVRQLSVEGEPVPTLEEMLDASRDKATLFVELKGETADTKMADDAVRIIKDKGMEDQAVLISLKYDVLTYIEEQYPEMLTGYLAFFSFGQIENTPFDYLALEEEISTYDTIKSIHEKGMKIMVWTVNNKDDIERFLTSNADAIITDSVRLSEESKEEINSRTPLEVILNYYINSLS